jgi:hypothetical protein
MEMVFDRGMGVTAIQVTHPWGTESYELKSAEVNQHKFGDPIPVNKPKEPGAKTPGPVISRADPTLSLTVEKRENGAHLRLKIKNPTEVFWFYFSSSQVRLCGSKRRADLVALVQRQLLHWVFTTSSRPRRNGISSSFEFKTTSATIQRAVSRQRHPRLRDPRIRADPR